MPFEERIQVSNAATLPKSFLVLTFAARAIEEVVVVREGVNDHDFGLAPLRAGVHRVPLQDMKQ
jgi:hypothetical protein